MFKYLFVKNNYMQFIRCILHAFSPLYSSCIVIFEVFSITNFKMWVDGSLNLQSVSILALISSTRFLKPLLINYEPLLSQAVLKNNFGDYKITAAKGINKKTRKTPAKISTSWCPDDWTIAYSSDK